MDKRKTQVAIDGKRKSRALNRPVRFRTCFQNVILDVLKARGWKQTDDADPETPDFDLNWADKPWVREHMDNVHFSSHQKVNHFRNYYEITRKDLLAKNIKRARRELQRYLSTQAAASNNANGPNNGGNNNNNNNNKRQSLPVGSQAEIVGQNWDDFDFIPKTYSLPGEYLVFVEAFKEAAANNTLWIMKPISRSQGKGIFLFDKLSQINDWKVDTRWSNPLPSPAAPAPSASSNNATNVSSPTADGNGVKNASGEPAAAAVEDQQAEKYVVQKYVSNPLLVGGKKFDLRIYVLVTSYQPLTVYIYREGFARFTGSRFSTDVSSINNNYIHLTNVAVQKTGPDYDESTGGKWDIRTLKLYLATKFGEQRVNELFLQIQHVVLHALLAVKKVMINDKHCFELYGYDILIDADFKVWLLEVNASPSMSANTESDYNMKFALLNDTLTVVDIENRLNGDETQIGGFDLIYRNGPIRRDTNLAPYSPLGCKNMREKVLRRMYKQIYRKRAEELAKEKAMMKNSA